MSLPKVSLTPGFGLGGDRYADGKGAWQRVQDGKVRHVTLIAFEAIVEANTKLRNRGLMPFLQEETRRNIVTVGVDLNNLVGKEFSVGDVRMCGVELADPCKRPSKLAKKSGFDEGFAGIGGIRAEILSDGIIAVGDQITV